jgi:ATP-dependent RNA helicase RhlE
MYSSRNSYSNSNNKRSGGNRGGRGFGGGGYGGRGRRSYGGRGRKIVSFDPSWLVKKAVANPVNIEDQPAYVAKHQFADFAIAEPVKQNVIARGYETPTPIQDQAIPYILEGRDLIGLANTGTGKTAAFLLPLIDKIYNQIINKQQVSKVLIIAPTRELAVQIEAELKLFAKGLNIYSALCIGGANIKRQMETLKRGVDFVIGTPGRLIDLEQRNVINFNKFGSIVLDEVDRMFDMGFINDMKYVITRLPEDRHSLFFSATLSSKLDVVADNFLTNPVRVEVETQKASTNVNQDIVKINGQSKIELLHDLLIQEGFSKVLVFGRTKHGLDKLSKILFKRGFKVAAIHGNKSQGQRQRALREFKSNLVQILLATDIASRGLDIDDVTHVINFDLPQTQEDYIHRIGRTGRANKTGVALSFVE